MLVDFQICISLSLRVSRCLTFGNFKLFFKTNKIINKWEQQKFKKIPHTVLEKIFSQNLISENFCKIELNPKDLELLE